MQYFTLLYYHSFLFHSIVKMEGRFGPLTECDLRVLWDTYYFFCVVVIDALASLLDSKFPGGLAH